MKEIGPGEALYADVLCENLLCNLNTGYLSSVSIETAKGVASKHDKEKGHETVLVRHDGKHRLTEEHKSKVKELTGIGY